MIKPVFGVSDQVPYKPGCTATEDGWKLEISVTQVIKAVIVLISMSIKIYLKCMSNKNVEFIDKSVRNLDEN